MKPAVLPVYYYHDHFRELLSFVRQTYDTLLTAEHYAFIAQFEELSKDSQCLFIRMVNRRGRIFRRKAVQVRGDRRSRTGGHGTRSTRPCAATP